MPLIIHPSTSSDARRQAMIEDLNSNRLPTAYLYEGITQSEHWLTVHQALSPFLNDSSCTALYEWIALETAALLDIHNVNVIGLGCGSGIKDAALLRRLKDPSYWPIDISENLALEAANNSPISNNYPIVLNLESARNIDVFLDNHVSIGAQRVYTLFGILPNFDPQTLAEQLKQFLKSGDVLLLSANLAPGDNYLNGVKRILPQYDNDITHDWLMAALSGIKINPSQGKLTFGQENMDLGLRRIVACWNFVQSHQMKYSGVNFNFKSGTKLEVFYSIRHTIPKVVEWLKLIGLSVIKHRASDSGEEAVFLCQVP